LPGRRLEVTPLIQLFDLVQTETPPDGRHIPMADSQGSNE
jgi:hypothetical protein